MMKPWYHWATQCGFEIVWLNHCFEKEQNSQSSWLSRITLSCSVDFSQLIPFYHSPHWWFQNSHWWSDAVILHPKIHTAWREASSSTSVVINVSELRPFGISLWSGTLNLSKISASCVNGSSVSWVQFCWLFLEIANFLKQLTMVISGSVDHHCSSIITASSIVMLGNSFLQSIALMYLWVISVRYLAFNNSITPWSIGFVT